MEDVFSFGVIQIVVRYSGSFCWTSCQLLFLLLKLFQLEVRFFSTFSYHNSFEILWILTLTCKERIKEKGVKEKGVKNSAIMLLIPQR